MRMRDHDGGRLQTGCFAVVHQTIGIETRSAFEHVSGDFGHVPILPHI